MNTWIIVTIIILIGGCLTGLIEWYHYKKIYESYVRESHRTKQLEIKEVPYPTVPMETQIRVNAHDVYANEKLAHDWAIDCLRHRLADQVLNLADISVEKDILHMDYIITARVRVVDLSKNPNLLDSLFKEAQ